MTCLLRWSLVLALSASLAHAQATPAPEPPNPPPGKVLFSRTVPSDPDPGTPVPTPPADATSLPDALPATPVTDQERAAILITGYDLDVHLIPAEAREEVHATLTLRNTTAAPLTRIPLQLSSTLRWQAVSTPSTTGLSPVPFTQSPIATDTDHTGYAQEAVLTPSAPLAPGASLAVSVFYTGEIRQSAARLELLGTPSDRAAQTDWDQIAPVTDTSTTSLRGFGDVLWYPVAAPIAILGDANKLFELVGRERLLESPATVALRLTVEYAGDPPEGAVFNGDLRPLARLPDEQDQLIAQTHGVATVDFPPHPLGFRALSLFLTAQQPTATQRQLLAVLTADPEVVPPYAEAASSLQPLMSSWFGASPLRPLLLLDHPGQPFADDAFLVAHLAADVQPGDTADAIVGADTHSWFRSQHPWIADGLAGFMSLLWTEHRTGRGAALAELQASTSGLALVEPDLSATPPGTTPGEPLTNASSQTYYRVKASAVWWQLREILGEDVLRNALASYRVAEAANTAFDVDPRAMQALLERVSGKPLGWFFDDWVYRDRGLPDLTITEVNPRPLPTRAGKSDGYLVAVDVRNDGDAIAEVPVTVRSDKLTASERLRIPAHGVASIRIPFEDVPVVVQVNDGSTPEVRTDTHTKQIEVREQK